MVAITGANGLLGSVIARQFLAEKIPIIGVRRKDSDLQFVADIQHAIEWREADVVDLVALHEALHNVHTVIHTAAVVSFNPRDSKKIFNVNVEGTANVVNACLQNGVSRLLHVSSVAALGIQKGLSSIDENTKWVDNPLHTPYAHSKYLGELEVARGYEEGLHTASVNPSVILAPGNWNHSSAKLFNYVWQEKPFYIDGHFNFVDARDVAALIFALYCTEKNSGERYIANSGSVSILQFFTEVANRLHKRAPFIAIRPSVAHVAAFFEGIRSLLTGSEPLFTKQTLRMGREHHVFENKKSIAALGIEYQSFEKTLDWCCDFYLRNNTTNKL
jgi:dihydroflavonol-4-reductase